MSVSHDRHRRGATHATVPNEKNKHILIGMRDGVTGEFKLVPKAEAVVSVFDSNFLIGDGIWEGIRAKNGRVQFAKDHIDRLFQSAKAMLMDLGLSKGQLLGLIHQTLDANDMSNEPHVHIRLVVSRGLKSTPYQNPSVNIGLPLIVLIPEIKPTDPAVKERGLRLITSHIRRGPPDVKDEMWNHISKATDVQACIGANVTGADESLMLDLNGFVKTCNSTNFFIVRNGEVWAPTKNNQMQGITRQKSIDVCRAHGIPVRELDFTLTEVYGADEAFCTGTFPSQIHVTEVDGRQIGDGVRGAITERIQQLYVDLARRDTERTRAEILDEVTGPRKSKL
ncbi:Aminotransferase class IV [Penicillium riverlandense]|uniref:Aminotransferase class IV n=1 Tax=Penicillium riverlandense TaxID=1903569 RepID=UPI002548B432|nr:Aminotransferase class IV [Penicillium riverlandense]KAJ5820527.1 Aminotransferase class IV [Penicillium riverlandense]